MQQLLIFTLADSSRLQYTLQVVLKQLLGLDFIVTNSWSEFVRTNLPKINYSSKKETTNALYLAPHTLLWESDIKPQDINVTTFFGKKAFFSVTNNATDLPIDVFAMSFYLLSRYEEYLPFEKDKHSRFCAKNSLAARHRFLHEPLVNQWALQLGKVLQKKYPFLILKRPVYQFQSTFDIDFAWAYKHKGFARTMGGSLLDIKKARFYSLVQRWQVLLGFKKDNFDIFKKIEIWHKFLEKPPIFFFLLGNYSEFDKNVSHQHPEFRQLIQQIAQQFPTYIHPSYQSNEISGRLLEEKKRLEVIIKKPVTASRQHFLKLHLPSTYRQLINAGIQADYSMGYADAIGFRASIATPFPWYDLQREEMTNLMIHPFQIMDVTLKNYLEYSPEKALETCQQLIETTRKVGGTFTTLWHNSSFSTIDGWQDWVPFYLNLLELAKE